MPIFQRILHSAVLIGLLASAHGQIAGTLDPSFDSRAGPNGLVRAIVVEPDGRLLVAGAFSSWDGAPRSGLVRLSESGALDTSFAPVFGDPTVVGAETADIHALALQPDGRILVGGNFRAANSAPREGLVQLLPDGRFDESFPARRISPVRAILPAPGGAFLIAGGFLTIDGVPTGGLARLSSTGQLDRDYGPLLAAVVPPPGVIWPASTGEHRALVLMPGGLLLVGGLGAMDFYPQIGSGLRHPVRFTPAGVLDMPFSTALARNTPPSGNAMIVDAQGRILIGGETRGQGPLMRVLADGSLDSSFRTAIAGAASSVAIVERLLLETDGKIIVAGNFLSVNGADQPRLARLFPDGSTDPRFAPSARLDGTVAALARDAQGRLLIGGAFRRVEGVARVSIARLLNPPLPPRIIAPPVGQLVAPGGNVLLTAQVEPSGGEAYQWYRNGVALVGETSPKLGLIDVRDDAGYAFEVRSATGVVRSPVATVAVVARQAGGFDASFVPSGTPGRVLPCPDGRVYAIAGDVITLLDWNGQLVSRLELTGSTIASALVMPDSKLLVARYSFTGGTISPVLERRNPDGSIDPAFNLRGASGLLASALALLPDGAIVLIAQLGGTSPVMRLSPDGVVDPSFGPPSLSATPDRIVALPDGKVLVRGNFFTTAGGLEVRRVARLDASGRVDLNWRPGFEPRSPEEVTLSKTGEVYLFRSGEQRILKLGPDGPIDSSFTCAITEISGPLSLWPQSDGGLLLSGATRCRLNGQLVNLPCRLRRDGSRDPGFLATTVTAQSGAEPLTIVAEANERLYATTSAPSSSLQGTTRPGFLRLYREAAGSARLGNLSTRAQAGAGERALVAGFVQQGAGSRTLLLRAAGPALGGFGVSGALDRLQLELYAGATRIGANDAWSSAGPEIASLANRVGAFPFPNGSRDAALAPTIGAGNYSIQITPVGGGEGIALAELYEDPSASANGELRLRNLSSRAIVNGSDALIAGFVVNGTEPKTLLFRAAGPALRDFGLTGVMPNPKLRLIRGSIVTAANDDWRIDPSADLTAAAMRQLGAFSFREGSLDSALLATVVPGQYSCVVESGDGQGGVVLVEVYDVSR